MSLNVMQEYRTNTEYTGSLGYYSVCYITSRIGWVSLKGIYRYIYIDVILGNRTIPFVPEGQPQQGTSSLDYILTKKADRRLICCVNVRRSPLKAPESNHNLVYAKVRIQRRSAPNRRKRDSTKDTPKLADLRRLMTDQNLRCQVATAMVDALLPIPDGTCISDIATEWPTSCFPLRPY